ncbi:MAG TPA: hypothetical protein VFI90_13730 [Rubrobacter sp.]|nr:hypothetical protein [Rubrobacter sp.]
MSQSTRGVPVVHDAIEEEFDRLASRLAEDVDLELEGIYRRADQRLVEIFGYAVAQGAPAELRLEHLNEGLG